jgi:hypothetical protein
MNISTSKSTKFTKGLFMRKSVLFSGAVLAAVVLSGVRAYADDAADIMGGLPNTYSQYDNEYDTGYDPNGYPVVTDLASQPGVYGGHTFTGWSILAADQSGSLDLFLSQASLTNMHGGVTSVGVGYGLNVAGQNSPYHSEAELGFVTTAASNNYFYITSQDTAGNLASVGPTPVFVVSNLNYVAAVTNSSGLVAGVSGQYIELENVTFSGSTGGFMSTFPNYAQANLLSESYTITDGTGSMELFDYVTSYSTAAALGGTAVPTGPVDVYGFMSVFPSSGLPGGGLPEFTATSIVPEPSAFVLAGMGLLGLLAIRRRRS